MKYEISPEEGGLLISIGVIILGNIVKSKNRDVGNFFQGIGIGAGGGTVAHIVDNQFPNDIPHHDIIALVAIPTVFVLDKSNVIKNKDISNNLYGIGLGLLVQHLLTEGSSLTPENPYYCHNGERLC